MDKKWVEEYVNKQVDAATKQAERGIRDYREFNIMNLIGWDFKAPYSNCLIDLPISVQMPFFEQLIMVLRPYHTEADFKKEYGFSVELVLDLWRQKRLLVTTLNPERYVGLDYLDPILEKEPLYLEMIGEVFLKNICDLNKGEGYFESCLEMAAEKIRTNKSLVESLIPDTMPRLSYRTMKKEDFIPLFATAYASLCGFGYEDLATGLLSRLSRLSMEELLKFDELLIFYPKFRAMEGVVTLQPSDFHLATEIGLATRAERFPVEVAKLLVRELEILWIKDIGSEQVVELRGKTAELRKLLFEIDRFASSGQFEKLPRQEAVEKAFEEARAASAEIARTRKLSTRMIHASLGILGGAVGNALPGYIGLLTGAALGGLVAIPFVEQSAEVLSKLGKKSHALAYFEVEQDLRKSDQ